VVTGGVPENKSGGPATISADIDRDDGYNGRRNDDNTYTMRLPPVSRLCSDNGRDDDFYRRLQQPEIHLPEMRQMVTMASLWR